MEIIIEPQRYRISFLCASHQFLQSEETIIIIFRHNSIVMHKIFFVFGLCILIACNQGTTTIAPKEANKELAAMFESYFNGKMELFPVDATANGDNRFNDQLPIDFTDGYREKLISFYTKYLDSLNQYNRDQLNETDQESYDIFKHEMNISLEGLKNHHYLNAGNYPIHDYIPFHQFWGLPLTLGQMGSGEGMQPFKTIQDYDNWIKRASVFSDWSDSAIVYFRKGMAANYVLPEKLVVKMITQMNNMVVADVSKSLFYGPVNRFPSDFNNTDKKRFTEMYSKLIGEKIVPSYKKLGEFLQKEYLPKARKTSGIDGVPGGDGLYKYLVRYWTTTDKAADEIYNTGLSEVKRILAIMDSVKRSTGFSGDLKAFFEYMKTDKRFMPYKTPGEVLDAFRKIQATIEPHLNDMFGRRPKTKFEIRQTEAFRAASASAEYTPGTPDGQRPGIFYVPIIDATKFNITSGMESLFLHEAIPGHHYQCSLQNEDTTLPKFRRFIWYGAYGEGWALYCESLGKELGLYTDPYQYMGALGDEMHRAIRLVVDVGLHSKKMSREDAIKYMMENEAISEEGATAEIERYMAIPGQALSYKIGALKIRELRNKYNAELGNKFKLASFHDQFLKFGCMPLSVVESSMNKWAEQHK